MGKERRGEGDSVNQCFSHFKKILEVHLIYGVAGVHQSDSVMHVYILFQTLFTVGFDKVLNIQLSVLYSSRTLWFIL